MFTIRGVTDDGRETEVAWTLSRSVPRENGLYFARLRAVEGDRPDGAVA
jgi:hypothetical protein